MTGGLRSVAIAALLFLGGCASGDVAETFFPTSKSYVAVTFDEVDKEREAQDIKDCHTLADGYKPGFSPGSVTQGATAGATNDAAEAVINPLVPAVGAAGGVVGALVSGAGLNGQASIKVFVRCLEKRSREDKAFKVADPNE